MVKFWVGPLQPFSDGVTTILPVVWLPTLAAVKEISPVPLAPRPMAVLEFVHEKVGFPVPENDTSTMSLAQTA